MTTFSAPRSPRASKTGVPIYADTSELARLAKDLAKASPEAWKACRLALRAAAQVVADDAKGRASWSSTIPGTIKVRVGRGSVKVIAQGSEAVAYEVGSRKSGPGILRHPVLNSKGEPKRDSAGGMEMSSMTFEERVAHRRSMNWSTEPTRPYLAPALDAHREQVAEAIATAVHAAVEMALRGV